MNEIYLYTGKDEEWILLGSSFKKKTSVRQYA